MPSHPTPLHRAGGKQWNNDGSAQDIYLDAVVFLRLVSNLTKMQMVKENIACLFFREHSTKHKHAHPYIIGFAGLISKYQ